METLGILNPKEECERLMNAILPLAIEMLERYGEFYPYGGKIDDRGEIVHVGVIDEDTDHPEPRLSIETMVSEFREEARSGACQAVAIVFDVKVVPPEETVKTDAIQVNLDHSEGYSVEVFFPYRSSGSNKVDILAPFAQKGKSQIFGPVN